MFERIKKFMGLTVIAMIRWGYQPVVSPILLMLGARCRFHPSCSDYAVASFQNYAFFQAFFRSFRRISRCHPWSEGGVDLP